MANTIILKRSATPGKSPTTSQLSLGEIAINTYDGKLFIKKDDGTPAVVEIGGVTSVNTQGGDVVLDTDDINEGTSHLYFTTARARGALSAGTGITYSSSTGVISTTQNLTSAGSPSFAGLTLTGNATSRDIIPAADVTYSLGSATYQWKDLYVGPGTIYVNGSPIASQTQSGGVALGGATNQDVTLQATGTGTLSIGAAAVTGDITLTSGKQIKDSANTKVLFANAIDMQSHKIINVTTPTASADAATKGYVDTAIGAISTSSITKGDSNVTVTDTGTGTVTVTVDGSTALTVDASGVTVAGNFTVSGTTTTVDSNTVTIADNIITLNSDATGSPSQNAGIEVERGDSTNVQLRWNEGIDKWQFSNDGSVYTSFATDTDGLTEGSTNLYFTNGRARTALSATTATGISYNSSTGAFSLGSIPNSSLSNNSITINGSSVALGGTRTLTTDDVADTSATNKYFTNAQARGAISVSGTGLAYNSSTGVISSNAASANTASTIVARDSSGNFTAGTITAALSGNATTATTLQTARTIAGVSFDGSANISLSTSNITEGSNLYYTNARVQSFLAGGTLAGNIVPATDNTYSLGSATKMWKDIYVGPGSLYVNGQKVLQDNSGSIVVSADINQNLVLSTTGTGNVELSPTGTGTINAKGPLVIYTGNAITSSDGGKIAFGNQIGVDSITSKSTNTDLTITGSGTGIVKVDDDLTVTGSLTVSGTFANINVTNLSVADNLVDLNSDVTSGTPTDNVGFRVMRGDSTAVQLRWNEGSGVWQFTNDGTAYASIVGTSTTQTLTNKTIAAGSNTISGLTNSNLSGSAGITNANLANSSVTVGTTTISLGASSTTLGGLTSVTSTTFVGALTGNADTATKLATARNINGVAFDGTAAITVKASTTNALTIGTGLSGTSFDGGSAVTIANTGVLSVNGNAGAITGIANSSDVHYIGTTSVALNRSSANLALTGISSVTLPGSTSGTVQLVPTAAVGTGTVLTIPATTGTIVTTGDSGTVTNTMLAGSIANAKLANSAITINGTSTSLGGSISVGTVTSVGGTGSVSGLTLSGTVTGSGNLTLGGSISGLTTSNLSATAAITNAQLANSTISGVALGSNLSTLTLATSGTGLSGSTTYNGSGAATFTVTSNATSANTASTIVARDASGNFTAGTVTAALSGNATTATTLQTARAINGVSFNGSADITVHTAGTGISISGTTVTNTLSTSGGSIGGAIAVTGAITATGEITAYYSDANLKKDIVEIQDPIAKVMSLRGVTFRPNETALALGITDKEEVGVIAQEVEAVLPQLVAPSAFAGFKTVRYEKLTALLLEAVKAQQLQIDALRAEISKLGGSAKSEL